jgi:hypothetical protein
LWSTTIHGAAQCSRPCIGSRTPRGASSSSSRAPLYSTRFGPG